MELNEVRGRKRRLGVLGLVNGFVARSRGDHWLPIAFSDGTGVRYVGYTERVHITYTNNAPLYSEPGQRVIYSTRLANQGAFKCMN